MIAISFSVLVTTTTASAFAGTDVTFKHPRLVQSTIIRDEMRWMHGRLLDMVRQDIHLTAVLLAAGDGKRFAAPTHKLLSPLRGLPLYEHALNAIIGSGITSVVVVTGAVSLPVPAGVTVVHNPLWRTGQRSSVLAGIAAARGSDAVIFGLADQPFITSESWQAVASGTGPIVMATYDGVRAHPVRLGLELWDEFIATTTEPDEGMRSFVRQHSQIVQEVACQGSLADIDTLEDLERWN